MNPPLAAPTGKLPLLANFSVDRRILVGYPSLSTMKTLMACLPLLAPTAARAAGPEVKLAGLQVVYDDGAARFDNFRTYNSDQGYGVALMIISEDASFVGFNEAKAAINIGGARAKFHYYNSDMSTSKDRHAIRLQLSAAKGVSVSADGTLKISGQLPIVLATGKEETRSEPFRVAAGTAIKFPAGKTNMPALEVKSAAKAEHEFGNTPFELVLTTNRRLEDFAGFRFYDKAGKSLEASRSGSSWMGFGNRGSGEITFRFKTPQTDLVLAVESWTGRKETIVKVDLDAGLAMPK